jgi:cysteine-rich repeat protein
MKTPWTIKLLFAVSALWGCSGPQDNCDANNPDCSLAACSQVLVCQPEDCGNGQDDNGNGAVDCADSDCLGSVLCPNCGDGIQNPGEQCDDGNQANGDGCESDCTLTPGPQCGDGNLDPGEQCDDGNNNNGDGCLSNCILPPANCGDGILNVGEQCDDGNQINGDGCESDCTNTGGNTCGNGVLNPGEQCDDGNQIPGDGCENDCTDTPNPQCGDGNVDAGEECDDDNNNNGDGCSSVCQNEECGDGVVNNNGTEQCDDGNNIANDGCENNCTVTIFNGCGDGNIDNGEECDDGNNIGGDGCRANCTVEECGDGVEDNAAGEECDDGNFLPGDGCDPICQNPPVEDVFTFNDVNQNITFDLAEYCDGMVTRHAVAHQVDEGDNNLRWRCGDVTEIGSNSYGQEYCEYSAVKNGNRITTATQIGAGSFSCLFTAVFNDEPSLDTLHRQQLGLATNLGATVTDVSLVRMQRGVNSRGAAIALINDCSNLAGSNQEVRQTACYQAFDAARDAGDTNRANQLRTICRGQDLNDDTRFAQAQALGAVIPVEGDAGFEKHREIRGCVATPRGGGVFFRNSDSNICGRTFRANNECGCSFADVPQAVVGFEFSIWFTPENNTIPPECRPALINGQPSDHLLICDVPSQEVPEIAASSRYQNDLTGFCNDRFGKNIGMFAPLDALNAGTCNLNSDFCGSFFE